MQKSESGWRRNKGILSMGAEDQVGTDLDLAKIQQLLKFLLPVKSKIGLDIGCGLGVEVRDISLKGGTCIGCDLDPQVLQEANREKEGKLNFICASADALPFKDSSFDYILAFDILEHVEDDQLLLSEVARVTKQTGIFVINVPNGAGPWELYRRVAYLAIKLFRRFSGQSIQFWPNKQAHIHFYSLFQLRKMFKDNRLTPWKIYAANLYLTMVLFAPLWYLQIVISKAGDEERVLIWENMHRSRPFQLLSRLDRALFNKVFFIFNTSFIFVCKKQINK